jgi:hypothetical protein
MRKNRATRLANRVGSVEELFMLIAPLKTAADKAEGRDKLPTRRKVETHFAAIEILTAREATAKLAATVKKASGKKPKQPPLEERLKTQAFVDNLFSLPAKKPSPKK